MKKGLGIFGRQYEIMYKNDVHAVGTVDRVLCEQMIKLDDNSKEYLYNSHTDLSCRYKPGARVFLEGIVNSLRGLTPRETVENIISYCRNIVINCDTDTEELVFGGTEEEIITRGTYWCTDIARVACVMFQIAGLPSRIIITANTKSAYSGHVVTEVYYSNRWEVADPTSGKIYRDAAGISKSTWDIHNEKLDGQFGAVAVSNYYVDDKEKYSYETSRVNDYYREILKHSAEQWAGGVRWVHGEDAAVD